MTKLCSLCGNREYYAKGFCKKCYNQNWHKQRYIENREGVLTKNKLWRDTYPDKSTAARIRASRKRGVLPMSKNKKCGAYLGIHIAEKVLSKVFKNVLRQPNNTPGYDFVCANGFKIDVKSSCSRVLNESSTISWMFHIRQNKIADYFLCLAFDNRENLNPMHMWLLPANIFNHTSGVGISTSTVDKWNEYRLDIDNVITCCDMLKNI